MFSVATIELADVIDNIYTSLVNHLTTDDKYTHHLSLPAMSLGDSFCVSWRARQGEVGQGEVGQGEEGQGEEGQGEVGQGEKRQGEEGQGEEGQWEEG